MNDRQTPVTTTARRITRAVNTLAGADGFAYFAADGAYLGATAAGTAPTDWAYAVATTGVITQRTAQDIIGATDDRQELEAWFAAHRPVLGYLGAEVQRRRQS